MSGRDDAIEAGWAALEASDAEGHMSLHRDIAVVVDAVTPIIRERIAQEIEGLGATFEAGQPILIDRNYAARIARGGTR